MDATPAIVRTFGEKDRQVEVRSTTYDSVSHRRGWGDSGYKVQVVEHECPECQFDRMVRRWDISPEVANEARYYCLNPNCSYYLGNTLSYAMHGSPPQRRLDPVIFERGDE